LSAKIVSTGSVSPPSGATIREQRRRKCEELNPWLCGLPFIDDVFSDLLPCEALLEDDEAER
jgi:hypothetical protein